MAVVVVAALPLGEISASELVCTPGAYPFAVKLFMDLHFGVGGDLAARSLVLLAAVGMLAGLPVFLPLPRKAESDRRAESGAHKKKRL